MWRWLCPLVLVAAGAAAQPAPYSGPLFDAHLHYNDEAFGGRPAPHPVADVVARIHTEVKKALDDPGVRQQLEAQGATVVGSTPAETGAFQRNEMAKFKRAVEISGAKAE